MGRALQGFAEREGVGMTGPFCIACKHCFIERADNVEAAKCQSPMNYTEAVSPVSGKTTCHYIGHEYCKDQRLLGPCGADATRFEAEWVEVAA